MINEASTAPYGIIPQARWEGQQQAYAEAQTEIDRLTVEIEEWRACARYDLLMEGPHFKGWDRSGLDRCRKKYIEAIK